MMQFLFYRGISLISRAIRFQTRSPYSHVAVKLGENEIYEAWHVGGVRKLRYATEGHSPGTVVDIFRVDPSINYDIDKARAYAQSQVGKGYDFLSVARFLTRRKAPSNDVLFCSEYGLEIASAAGFRPLHIVSSEASPRDLSISPVLYFSHQIGGN